MVNNFRNDIQLLKKSKIYFFNYKNSDLLLKKHTENRTLFLYEELILDMEGKSMTKAEILKKEILRQYRSVRQFALEMNIPYSTLVTALERGIEGMAYGTVIKMCDKLSLNPVDFSSLERDTSLGAQLLENRVMQYYVKLNQAGRDKILELMDDFVQIDKYKAKGKKTK